jgi:nucleoside-diphosphate-sugar epimerase
MAEQLDWGGRRVLVTGADGFLGSHLCERLLELGARVLAVVRGRSDSGTSQLALRNLAPRAERLEAVIPVDVGGPDAMALLATTDAEIVFHLAAAAYVPYSFDHPHEVHRVNTTGTLNLLETARRLPRLRRLVVCSSSEVYGSARAAAIDEEHALEPTSPYAASKLAADRFAHAYRQTWGLPIAIMRPFNCYGPRHVYDVVPKFLRSVLRGEPPTIYGAGEQRRDLTYVSDMIEGFLAMGASPCAEGETVNFGSGRDISVLELARTIIEIGGQPLEPVHLEPRKAEVARLTCDASKAKRLFGWQARVALEDGLSRNYAWLAKELAR